MCDAQLVAWQVVCSLTSSSDAPSQPHVQLEWELERPHRHSGRVTMAAGAPQLRLLIHELKQAAGVMTEAARSQSDG